MHFSFPFLSFFFYSLYYYYWFFFYKNPAFSLFCLPFNSEHSPWRGCRDLNVHEIKKKSFKTVWGLINSKLICWEYVVRTSRIPLLTFWHVCEVEHGSSRVDDIGTLVSEALHSIAAAGWRGKKKFHRARDWGQMWCTTLVGAQPFTIIQQSAFERVQVLCTAETSSLSNISLLPSFCSLFAFYTFPSSSSFTCLSSSSPHSLSWPKSR